MKKKIYIIVFSIIIYLILQFIYNNYIVNNNLQYVYVLNKNLNRGDFLKMEDLNKIKVDLTGLNNYTKEFKEGYIKYDCYEGQLLLSDMLLDKKEYDKIENNNELTSIKLNQPDDVLGYKISKYDVVNVYFSGKVNDMSNILKLIAKENVISSNESGYVTIRLLENIKVKDIYTKNNNANSIIDTIIFETDRDNVLKINNLKNYGKFSVSLVK
jgi:hypothetical protein